MRKTFLALFLLTPALALGQSLGEVAKKEKSRREKNKQEGKEVQVLTESDLPEKPEGAPAEAGAEVTRRTTSPRM